MSGVANVVLRVCVPARLVNRVATCTLKWQKGLTAFQRAFKPRSESHARERDKDSRSGISVGCRRPARSPRNRLPVMSYDTTAAAMTFEFPRFWFAHAQLPPLQAAYPARGGSNATRDISNCQTQFGHPPNKQFPDFLRTGSHLDRLDRFWGIGPLALTFAHMIGNAA